MPAALIGRCASFSGPLGTAVAVSVTANTTAGNTVIMAFRTGGTVTVSSVTDSQGNTWAVDIATVGSTGRVSICSAPLTTALTTSDTITIHLSASQTPVGAAFEYSGLLTSGALDASAQKTITTTSSTVGPTGTTVQADELAVTALGTNATQASMSVDAAWNIEDTGQSGVTNSPCQFADQVLTATGTVSATWTVATSSNMVMAIATYQAAAVAAAPALAFMPGRMPLGA